MKNEMKEQTSDYTAKGRTSTHKPDQLNSRRSDKQTENKPNTARAKSPLSVICQLSSVICFVICLLGCEKASDKAVSSPTAAQISGSIVTETPADVPEVKSLGGTHTRAAGTDWTMDDRIGVTATSTGATAYANVQYHATTAAGTFEVVSTADSDNTIYFQDAEDVTFTAYYPYDGVNGTAAGTNGILRKTITAADQTPEAQPGIDYLWSTATTSNAAPQVSFRFSHAMSRLCFVFIEGAGVTFPADGLKYELSDLVTAGSFNTLTGTTQADDGAAAGQPGGMTVFPPSGATQKPVYSFILWPQKKDKATLTVTLGGQPFTATLEFPPLSANDATQGLAAGYSYLYNVTIQRTGLEVSAATIKDWTQVTGGAVTAK